MNRKVSASSVGRKLNLFQIKPIAQATFIVLNIENIS